MSETACARKHVTADRSGLLVSQTDSVNEYFVRKTQASVPALKIKKRASQTANARFSARLALAGLDRHPVRLMLPARMLLRSGDADPLRQPSGFASTTASAC